MIVQNLPTQSTSFVGREKELAEIAHLLSNANCRLLTLVGLGGTGKSRLANQAAALQLPYFAHGAYFVPLAPVGSPDLLVSAIAGALHISSIDTSGDPDAQILRYFGEKHILLIMDNFEHLLEGAGLLTDILRAGSRLKILVTSRERLNLQEEWLFAVDGLSFPSDQPEAPLESYGSVALFVERARQVNPRFSLTENHEAVKTICRQVEGMPLALELAASWLRVMSCRQIAAHMENPLGFLTTPLRNVPERHHSLRVVLEQSWNLLLPAEKEVLMRLSIFQGGFDWEAGAQVADATLPILAGLVDKSLIRLNDVGRYDLHELVHQYAAEKLLDLGETNHTARRHADYYLKLAEGAEAHTFGREQVAWCDRLAAELNNLHVVLAWSVGTEDGLRLVGALRWFFSERGYWNEGLDWMERMLAPKLDVMPSTVARALIGAGALAGLLGDQLRVGAFCEQALTLARATNDRWSRAWALCHLGLFVSDDQSIARLEESLALFRALDDTMGISHTLIRLSFLAREQGDYASMCLLIEEASILATEAGDKIMMGWAADGLGTVAWFQDHDLRQAKMHFERSIILFREARFPYYNSLYLTIDIELAKAKMVGASAYETAMIYLSGPVPDDIKLRLTFIALASVTHASGQFERAAQLLGASSSIDRDPGHSAIGDIAALDDQLIAQLGETAFTAAWEAGRAMTREQARAFAVLVSTLPVGPLFSEQTEVISTRLSSDNLLKKRELEVIRLVANGLSNSEIAARLVLSPVTIKWYLSEIYGKLEVANRTQAVTRARELALLD